MLDDIHPLFILEKELHSYNLRAKIFIQNSYLTLFSILAESYRKKDLKEFKDLKIQETGSVKYKEQNRKKKNEINFKK